MSVAKRMTRRRGKLRRMQDYDVFEKEFAIESLKSERLRVTILMGAIISSVTLLALLPVFLSKVVPMGHVEVRGREQAIQIYQVA